MPYPGNSVLVQISSKCPFLTVIERDASQKQQPAFSPDTKSVSILLPRLIYIESCGEHTFFLPVVRLYTWKLSDPQIGLWPSLRREVTTPAGSVHKAQLLACLSNISERTNRLSEKIKIMLNMETSGRSVGPSKGQLLLLPIHFLNYFGSCQKHIGTLWSLLGSSRCYQAAFYLLQDTLCARNEIVIPVSVPLKKFRSKYYQVASNLVITINYDAATILPLFLV